MEVYLGIDVGSVSTNTVMINEGGEVLKSIYMRTQGQPIATVQRAIMKIKESFPSELIVKGVGTTGSARQLAAVITGADVVKNEITAHAVAASYLVPGVQTVVEIGGQDSKIIILREGMVADFAMNTVCAAGTGSFLDQQAARLNIPIVEFGKLALKANNPVRIAGRCAVFAESDMIHKQQMGHGIENIVAGLCEALVRNYLNNVGKGKEILPPIIFQGGVAANAGMCEALSKALGTEVIVPPHYAVMGAVGAALLARENLNRDQKEKTRFFGFELGRQEFDSSSFECGGCANKCEIIEIRRDKEVLARWGDRCGKWESNLPTGTDTG